MHSNGGTDPERGERGRTGAEGQPGAAGQTGATGEQGEQGEQGERGEARDWAGVLVSFIAVGIAVVGLLSIFSYANTNRDLATNARDISEETRRAQREECVRVEIVKAALRGVVAGSVPSDKSGPGAAYYRRHPDELKAAREGSKKTIQAFAIQQCPGLSRDQLNKVLADALGRIAKGQEPRPTEEALDDKPKASVRGDPGTQGAVARKVRRETQGESAPPPASINPPSRKPAPKPAPKRPAQPSPSPQPSPPPAPQQPAGPPAPTTTPTTPAPPPPGQLHIPPELCAQLPPSTLKNPLCP